MYIRLGNTRINYNASKNEFIIFAEVLSDATIGYESPVLVHSADELNIWFGKNFKEREYFINLLKENEDLALLLSKPISPLSVETLDDYIDLSKYKVSPEVYYGSDMFPTEGKKGIIYRVVEDVSAINHEDWIWTGNFYIPVKDLPQNLPADNSVSLLNRDTLRIGWKEGTDKEWGWSCPGIEEDEEKEPGFDWNNINLEKISEETETLAFSLKLPEERTFEEDGYYVLLGKTVFYTGVAIPISNAYYTKAIRVYSLQDLVDGIKEEWKVNEDLSLIWRGNPTQVTYLYKWPGLSLEPNFQKTQKIISSYLSPVISFWSRTIGRCREEDWEEDNINITIEQVIDNPERWRALIQRYDYLEVFEGTLTPSEERLDWIIEQGSKLVHASISDTLITSLENLPEGTWQLRGATSEETGNLKDRLIYTLGKILQEGDKTFFPDFVLIPNPEEWMDEDTAQETYKNWLRIAQEYSLQFLIQNTENNLTWNILDPENRLVWFWNSIEIQKEERPGYYLFLEGLLSDIYSMTSKYLQYNPPTNTPYETTETPLESELIKYKSNYLVNNNHTYYYKEYQNGKDWETTIWMRFVMGKITRELEKNMGIYLGSFTTGELIEKLRGILGNIENRFTIVRSITISSYDVSYSKQKVDLVIDTTISDLMQNNMSLDININYNKNN